MAKRVLEKLKHMENIRADIEILDRKQILAEVQSYKHPPEMVHTVMSATCELLGMDTRPLQARGGQVSHKHNGLSVGYLLHGLCLSSLL